VIVAASPCPECGAEQEEVTGYPEDPQGRYRVYLICRGCGCEEDLGLLDGVI
jgi:hypothetical protein